MSDKKYLVHTYSSMGTACDWIVHEIIEVDPLDPKRFKTNIGWFGSSGFIAVVDEDTAITLNTMRDILDNNYRQKCKEMREDAQSTLELILKGVGE